MKLRRYLDKDQPENSICLMSIMNIKFKHVQSKENKVENKSTHIKDLKNRKEKIEQDLEKMNSKKDCFNYKPNNLLVKMEKNSIKNLDFNRSEIFDLNYINKKKSVCNDNEKMNTLLTDRQSKILPNLQNQIFKNNNNNNVSIEVNNGSNVETENSINKNNSILSIVNSSLKQNMLKSQIIGSMKIKTNNSNNFPLVNINSTHIENTSDKNMSSLIPLELAMKKIDMNNKNKRVLKSAAKNHNNEFIINKIYNINDKLNMLENEKYLNTNLLNYCQESLVNLNASINNLNTSTKIAQALKEINILNEYYEKLNNQKIRYESVEKSKFLNNLKRDIIKETSKKEITINYNLSSKKNNNESRSLEANCPKINTIKLENVKKNNIEINSKSNILNIGTNNIKIKNENKSEICENIIQNLNDKFVYEVICLKDLEIISKVMKNRTNWVLKQNKNDFVNFIWKYSNKKVPFCNFNLLSSKIKTTKSFNHLEFHYEMTNKKFFFSNLIEYCDLKNIDPFNIVPFTIIINKSKINQNKNFASFKEIHENLSIHIKKEFSHDFVFGNYGKLFTISDKQNKVKNIKCKIPNSYILGKNYWILKPDNLYQGKLIKISDTIDDIIKEAKSYINVKSIKDDSIKVEKNENLEDDNSNDINNLNNKNIEENKDKIISNDEENLIIENKNKKRKKKGIKFVVHNLLIQKYIENPLLFNNRKFDIRVFILIDHQSNLYMFKEGHLKTSSEVYDISTKHSFVHITNYSLQKYNPNFEKYEKGNELGFDDFQKYLDNNNYKIDVRKDIMPRIKEKVKICVESCSKRLFKKPVSYTFELYGIDLILDNNFNPYIFEINDNPGLTISSPIIEILIPRILDDMFRITIDTIYDQKNTTTKSEFSVNGYSNEENMFEKICCLI